MVKATITTTLAVTAMLWMHSATAGLTEWFEFTLEGGHIKIPVVIAGHQGTALLDTGATFNSINAGFVAGNGLRFDPGKQFEIISVSGKDIRNSYNNVPVSLFGDELSLDDLVEIDMGEMGTDLSLGGGFFQPYVVQIDYPNSRMRFVERDSIDLKKTKNVRARSNRLTGMPMVNVELNGEKKVWLLLDTGADVGLVLKRILATSDGWLEKYGATPLNVKAAGSVAAYSAFRLPQLKLGPYTVENVLTTVPDEGETLRLSSDYRHPLSSLREKKIKGLLGYDVLKHFVLTIDYRLGHVHVAVPE